MGKAFYLSCSPANALTAAEFELMGKTEKLVILVQWKDPSVLKHSSNYISYILQQHIAVASNSHCPFFKMFAVIWSYDLFNVLLVYKKSFKLYLSKMLKQRGQEN